MQCYKERDDVGQILMFTIIIFYTIIIMLSLAMIAAGVMQLA